MAIRVATLLTVLGCLVALLYAAPAHAQATRTWVSGVGDDANPCSRTAPCKTFAGAISKTAAGGEINCLDSAGYGAVTITKAITIHCEGVVGSVLVSGTNGIVVQAGPSDVVILRGLEVNGIGTGINGIRFLAGAALIVDECLIYGFTTNGIDVALGASAAVSVNNTQIYNLGGDGIRLNTTAGTASMSADHVTVSRTHNGIEVAGGGIGTVSNSMIFNTTSAALASAGGAILDVSDSQLLSSSFGANASVSGASIGLTNDKLYFNNQAVNAVAGSTFATGGNNKLFNNGSNGATPNASMTTE
jgi:hypothetical protein